MRDGKMKRGIERERERESWSLSFFIYAVSLVEGRMHCLFY